MSGELSPRLSVVVAIVSDTTDPRVDVSNLAGCLEAIARQTDPPSMEVIVSHLPDVEGLEVVKARYPSVKFLPVTDARGPRETGGGREHHDVLRARAMSISRGGLIALLEDHARPDPHWCANIVKAHEESYAGIGGAMDNLVERPLNWAVYFCDYGKYQNPLPEGEAHFASDSNVSFKRTALDKVRDSWAQAFREIIVNGALMALGEKIVLRRDIVVSQCRTGLRFWPAMRERYVWGRSYAATRNATLSLPMRLVLAMLSPVLPFLLTVRLARTAFERRRYIGKFLMALPLTVVLLASWSIGEGLGYITGVRRA
ncbi:MAG: hypothetical protein L0Y57_12325 [Beijerinckiaceae bacterium]|nr:hypothetical protein [Beijerinckiaceae bacterium]